jgi:hypothetical protein
MNILKVMLPNAIVSEVVLSASKVDPGSFFKKKG